MLTQSTIFKSAHQLAKLIVGQVGDYMIAFSLSLKYIYSIVKSGVKTITDQAIVSYAKHIFEVEVNKTNVPDWILRQNLSNEEYYAVTAESYGQETVHETEKAVLIEFDTSYGYVKTWCPKSVLV